MAKKSPKSKEPESGPASDWGHEVAYKLVDLYVRELTERREKKILDVEGLVESYLYVLGRLKASEHEMGGIVKAIKKDMAEEPESPEKSGLKEAVGDKKLSSGLLKALEGM